jgi:hypothetical protein
MRKASSGKVWWHRSVCARALDHQNTNQALQRHVCPEHKNLQQLVTDSDPVLTIGSESDGSEHPEAIYIVGAGFYSLRTRQMNQKKRCESISDPDHLDNRLSDTEGSERPEMILMKLASTAWRWAVLEGSFPSSGAKSPMPSSQGLSNDNC